MQNKILQKLGTFLFAALLSTQLCSCYRMPTDDDCSLIPMTNNPSVTRQRSDGLAPQVAY